MKQKTFSKLIFEKPVVLPGRKRFLQIFFLFFFRTVLNLLDLTGVAIVAFLAGSLSSGIFLEVDERLEGILPSGSFTQQTVLPLAAIALLLFVSKSILSAVFLYLATVLGASLEEHFAAQAFGNWLRKSYSGEESIEEIQVGFVRGMRGRYAGLLASKVDLVGEGTLFVILSLSIVMVSPGLGVAILAYLAGATLILLKVVLPGVQHFQSRLLKTEGATLRIIEQTFASRIEISLSGERVKKEVGDSFRAVRRESSVAFGLLRLFTGLPRHVLEVVAIVGLSALTFLVVQFSSLEEQGGQLGFALAAIFRMLGSLIPLQSSMQFLRSSRVDAKSEIDFEAKDGIQTLNSSQSEPPFSDLISIEELGFSKRIDPNFAQNFSIARGNWTLLSGGSGLGKTIILRRILAELLQRDEFKAEIAYCPQFPKIIDGNYFKNIFMRHYSEDEAFKAKALSTEFGMSDPRLFDESISTLGNLSGGQLIRLGIIRAMMLNPEILILDEPTASLDKESASKVLGTLKDMFHGSVVLSSHDMRFADACDYHIRVIQEI